jgi:hypothetical protein
MPENKEAIASHPILSRAPQLSAGKITPIVIRNFENHVENFFMNAKNKPAEDEKVTKILGCFESPLVNNWIAVNRERLCALTFDKFMNEFRTRWLPRNWVEDIRTQMLGSRLDPKQTTFENWATDVQTLNFALLGTDSYIDDDAIRRQLEANIDPDLRARSRREKVSKIDEFLPWLERMAEIDDERQVDRKRMAEVVEEMRPIKRPFNPARSVNPNRNSFSTGASSSGSSQSHVYPPKLTDEERQILTETDGCFKCRKPNAGHRANKCTVIISGTNYKPVTRQSSQTESTKKSTRPTPVASLTDATSTEQSATPLAAIFPSATIAENSFSDLSGDSLSSVSFPSPLKCDHLLWKCHAHGNSDSLSVNTTALIDSGAHMVFIRPDLADRLNLEQFPLPQPELVSVAIDTSEPNALTHFVKLKLSSRDGIFTSTTVTAVIARNLCMPIILGLPFLCKNEMRSDYARRTCVTTVVSPPYDLLGTKPSTSSKSGCPLPSLTPDVLGAIRERITTLSLDALLTERETNFRKEFSQVFEPLPHVNELPLEPRARIRLKDPNSIIKSRNYPCPRKWKEAWHTLLQQHLDAGRIRPSSAAAGSGAFIIPKADPTVLPRWVNDYRQLNTNTITDSFPIPRVNEILSDIAQGTYFATIDMTNSFFQTRMHDEDVGLTAVNTPWGLYEWVVMPMGIKNAPAIHQRRVSIALRPWIGKICHAYIDDIAVWSRTLEEHELNVRTILTALSENSLYCNPKKTKLFSTEIQFLGHRISAKGIEADEGKADRIINWPTPTSAKQVRGFLGLVRYLAAFLPKLADFTTILDELTRKECDKLFPPWTTKYQTAFDGVKALVTSKDCLTTIDPSLMPDYKIFVTTDASDTGSGAILSFGPSYELARPVAYESRSFKGAELNYPVHEKELLAIIRALAKWRSELLGYQFQVWTDHRTLEHFNTQRDLSRRQARWMEFLSQYDATIHYLPGESNCAADALSRLPDPALTTIATLVTTNSARRIKTRFDLEDAILDEIRTGYEKDPFTLKLTKSCTWNDKRPTRGRILVHR